jgi:hypothetical protein
MGGRDLRGFLEKLLDIVHGDEGGGGGGNHDDWVHVFCQT